MPGKHLNFSIGPYHLHRSIVQAAMFQKHVVVVYSYVTLPDEQLAPENGPSQKETSN